MQVFHKRDIILSFLHYKWSVLLWERTDKSTIPCFCGKQKENRKKNTSLFRGVKTTHAIIKVWATIDLINDAIENRKNVTVVQDLCPFSVPSQTCGPSQVHCCSGSRQWTGRRWRRTRRNLSWGRGCCQLRHRRCGSPPAGGTPAAAPPHRHIGHRRALRRNLHGGLEGDVRSLPHAIDVVVTAHSCIHDVFNIAPCQALSHPLDDTRGLWVEKDSLPPRDKLKQHDTKAVDITLGRRLHCCLVPESLGSMKCSSIIRV